MAVRKSEKVTETKGKPSGLPESDGGKREETRSFIAKFYVILFLLIIAVALLGGGILMIFKVITINDTKDVIVTLSGILSGPLGFIIGYYFKATKDR